MALGQTTSKLCAPRNYQGDIPNTPVTDLGGRNAPQNTELERLSGAYLIISSVRDGPAGAFGAIQQLHALCCQLISDPVGFGELLGVSGLGAVRD